MDVKFKHFKMIEIDKNKYGEFNFSDSINIISSGNTKGKSSMLKSMMYCLGFNIKKWSSKFKKNDYIHILTLTVNNIEYTISRWGNIFLINDKVCFNEKEYRTELNKLFNINVKLTLKDLTKTVLPYPTDLFIFSYIDQDSSYTGDLFKCNHSNLAMYQKDEILKILKEYLGILTDDLILLEEEKMKLKKERSNDLSDLKKVESFLEKIRLDGEVEMPLNSQELKEIIVNFEKEINNIIEQEILLEKKRYKLKRELKTLEIEKLDLEEVYEELNDGTDRGLKSLGIDEEFKVRYKQEMSKKTILMLYGECRTNISDKLIELEKNEEKLKELIEKLEYLEKKYTEKNRELKLNEILEANANFKFTQKLNYEKERLELNLEKLKIQIKDIEKTITTNKKKIAIQENLIKEDYELELENMREMLKTAELEKFKEKFYNLKIDQTGTQLNIEYVGMYYIYMYIFSKYSKIKLPIIWDTVINSVLDKENDEQFEKFINEKVLSLDNQLLFTNVPTDNDVKIKDNNNYNYVLIGEKICEKENTDIEKEIINKLFKLLKS